MLPANIIAKSLCLRLLLGGMCLFSGKVVAQNSLFPGSAPTNGQTMRLAVGGKGYLEFVWVEKLQAWVGKRPVTRSEFHFSHPHHIGPAKDAAESGGGQKPISNISFKDAADYAAWVNARVRHFLPSNAIVSLPRDSDLHFLRSQSLWTDEDQPYAWLKCYGVNCPPTPAGPLLTLKNIAAAPVSERPAGTSKARRIAEIIEFDTKRWEWTTDHEKGLQVVNGPSLMTILLDQTTIQYSDSMYIDSSCPGAMLGFRLIIRQ